MRKWIMILVALVLVIGTLPVRAGADNTEEQNPLLKSFIVRGGDPESKKIAITVDDGFDLDYFWKDVELCRQYGITMTFFPIARTEQVFILKEEDREKWIDLIESGCEIGSHSYTHYKLGHRDNRGVLWALGMFQQTLDEVLGFHYQVRWLRPPYGSIQDRDGNENRVRKLIQRFGYSNIVNWNVSQTKAQDAFKRVKNGSILLFHAREKDYKCLQELIPMLLEAGYEPVTVSELLGFDPPEISDELYVYDLANYQ